MMLKMWSCTFVFGLLFQYISLIIAADLVAVTVVVNHGDTIPSKFYQTDPYQNPKLWQQPLGQLSNLGKQQSYQVGKWLLKRYAEKIPFYTVHYNASQTYCFSEDRDESLMSGECLMAGLYPPIGDEIWNRRINWRPTPVHNSPLYLDNVIGRGVNCSKFESELKKIQHGRFYRIQNKEDVSLLKYLTDKTGENFDNIGKVPALYNILTVERNHNLTLPEWTDAIYPNILSKIVLDMSIIRTKNPEITRLSIGPFFGEIRKQFEAVVTHNSELGNPNYDLRKFKIYIGNDTIIYDTLNGLKVPSVGVVPFGASLILELWNSTGTLYVNMLYKSTPELHVPAQRLRIGGCKGIKCPYEIFNSTISNYAIDYDQYVQLCNQ